MTIPDSVVVGSAQLKAGTYRVEWQESGPLLNVTFLKNDKAVATAQGRMVEKKEKASDDSFILANTGVTKRLVEIDFGGGKHALVFTPNPTAKN